MHLLDRDRREPLEKFPGGLSPETRIASLDDDEESIIAGTQEAIG